MSPSRTAFTAALFAALAAFVVVPSADAKEKVKAPVDEGPTFNREAAATALKAVDLVKCKVSGGPRGAGHVAVTFRGSGAADTVVVDRGPYIKSPVERCIVAAYRKAQVPAFRGDSVTVGMTFRID